MSAYNTLVLLIVLSTSELGQSWDHVDHEARRQLIIEQRLRSEGGYAFSSQSKLISPPLNHHPAEPEMPALITSPQQQILDIIDEVSRGQNCYSGLGQPVVHNHVFLPNEVLARSELDIPGPAFRRNLTSTTDRVELLASLLSEYKPSQDGSKLLRTSIDELLRLDSHIFRVRLIWLKPVADQVFDSGHLLADWIGVSERKKRLTEEQSNKSLPLDSPWLRIFTLSRKRRRSRIDQLLREGSSILTDRDDLESFAEWTAPYYSCDLRAWLVSYTGLITSDRKQRGHYELRGLISVDIDVTHLDINQCDEADDGHIILRGTHKCHRETSKCLFSKGHGWRKGGYYCECKKGFYSPTAADLNERRDIFNGSMVELAWDQKVRSGGLAYDVLYTCRQCAEGCDECTDGSPCLNYYDLASPIALLLISLICITMVLLPYYIYKHRNRKTESIAEQALQPQQQMDFTVPELVAMSLKDRYKSSLHLNASDQFNWRDHSLEERPRPLPYYGGRITPMRELAANNNVFTNIITI